jgi:hypothetical protein
MSIFVGSSSRSRKPMFSLYGMVLANDWANVA